MVCKPTNHMITGLRVFERRNVSTPSDTADALFDFCLYSTVMIWSLLAREGFYLVDFREFKPLLQRAAPTNGGNVEHSVPELNERSPAGNTGRMVKGHDACSKGLTEAETWI